MRFFPYGSTAAAGRILPLIGEALKARGHECTIPPPLQPGVTDAFCREIKQADLGVFCLSSGDEEIAVMTKMRNVVIIADTPGSELKPGIRAWAREQRAAPAAARRLKAVLLATRESRDDAIAFGYPPDALFHIGLPPHWGCLYRQMADMNVAEARDGIFKSSPRGPTQLAPDDTLVYVPGTQFPEGTNWALLYTVLACRWVFERFVLAFVPHPWERAPKSSVETYDLTRALERRRILLNQIPQAYLEHLTGAQRYRIADVVVDSGARTESIIAAYARLSHVLHYRDRRTMKFLALRGLPGGRWYVAERGAMRVVGPHRFLTFGYFIRGLKKLKQARGTAEVFHNQMQHFPLPRIWETAPQYAEFLEKIAAGDL